MRKEILNTKNHFEEIKVVWEKLLSEVDHHFFLSWPWISSWCSTLAAKGIWVNLMVIVDPEGIPQAAFFGHNATFLKYGFIPIRTFTVNALGIDYFDDIVIEYNNFLVAPTYSLKKLVDNFFDNSVKWDELHLPGFVSDISPLIAKKYVATQTSIKTMSSYYVDLKGINGEDDYLNGLSKNTRYQIRRSVKEYEKRGELKLNVAASLDDALKYYGLLKELHQKQWLERDHKGAFSNQFTDQFHDKLISDFFESGCIQLIKLTCNDEVVGVIYNFEYRGHVYYYQSGFVYEEENNKVKPGMVMHYFSVLKNRDLGNSIYDFLAGDFRYKKALSTDSNDLYWLIIHKDDFRYKVQKVIRYLKKSLLNEK